MKRILSGLILTIGALLLLALLNLNWLVQRNKDFLLARAGQSLGRDIGADKIRVTLWPFSAHLERVTVSGAPPTPQVDLLSAKAMRVELQFLPLLVGQIRLRKLDLDTPLLTLSSDDPPVESDSKKKRRLRKVSETELPAANQNVARMGFLLAAPIKITEGTLRYRNSNSGRELIVSQINLRIDGNDGDGRFLAELGAAVMTEQTNLRLKGRFGPLAGVNDYRDLPIDGELQVEALDLGKVHSVIPQLKRGLPRVLQFDGTYTTKDLRFKGSLNNLSLKGAITGSDASVRFE